MFPNLIHICAGDLRFDHRFFQLERLGEQPPYFLYEESSLTLEPLEKVQPDEKTR
jgi:hypothetical protein